MKFLHTADIHWGMVPDADKPWSVERANAIKNTFKNIIELAKINDVDCLFISGDLFHRQPIARDLKEVNYLFSTIPSIRVFIIAGNHDRIRSSSAANSFSWAPNVTFFMSSELSSVYIEEINTEVHGFSYHTSEIRNNLIDSLHAPDDGRIHILMAHGGDPGHLPFDKNALASNGFNYMALGHIHKPEIYLKNRIAMCGSPEPLDKTEIGAHGVFIGEINVYDHEIKELKFIPTAKAQYVPLIVNVTTESTNTELTKRITEEALKRGTQNIYRFRIRGKRDPDIVFDLEQIFDNLKVVEIIDESEPQYNFSELFSEHSGDMIGFYIQALQKDDMSSVEKKALYYGIDALLHTTDERN